jgi:hypothetical protein
MPQTADTAKFKTRECRFIMCLSFAGEWQRAKAYQRYRGNDRPSYLSATRAAQELLGHAGASTTVVYTDVMNRRALCVRSPIDRF